MTTEATITTAVPAAPSTQSTSTQIAETAASTPGLPAPGTASPSTSDTQPAPQPTPTAQPEKSTFGEAVTYQPTGDSNLDLALAFVGKHGLDPEHTAIVAATKGDFGPVKALMAEKGVPGWEAHIALAEKGYADYVKVDAEKTAAIQSICVNAAGSEQEWTDVLTWASANAEPHEKEQVNAALAQGGVVAQALAAFLVTSYRSAPGVTYTPRENAVRQDASRSSTALHNGALSPREYAHAVAELRRTQGVNFAHSAEYRQLQQRRAMYRG